MSTELPPSKTVVSETRSHAPWNTTRPRLQKRLESLSVLSFVGDGRGRPVGCHGRRRRVQTSRRPPAWTDGPGPHPRVGETPHTISHSTSVWKGTWESVPVSGPVLRSGGPFGESCPTRAYHGAEQKYHDTDRWGPTLRRDVPSTRGTGRDGRDWTRPKRRTGTKGRCSRSLETGPLARAQYC